MSIAAAGQELPEPHRFAGECLAGGARPGLIPGRPVPTLFPPSGFVGVCEWQGGHGSTPDNAASEVRQVTALPRTSEVTAPAETPMSDGVGALVPSACCRTVLIAELVRLIEVVVVRRC